MSKGKTTADKVADLVLSDLGLDAADIDAATTDALDDDDIGNVQDQVSDIVNNQVELEATGGASQQYPPITFVKSSVDISESKLAGQSMYSALEFLNVSGKDVKHDLQAFAETESNDPSLREKAKALLRNNSQGADDNTGGQTFAALKDVLIHARQTQNRALEVSTVKSLQNFAAADHLSPRLRTEASKLIELDDDALTDAVCDLVEGSLGLSDDDADEDPIFS